MPLSFSRDCTNTSSSDQEWRALKNAETALVCRLRLDPSHPWKEEMNAFFEWFRDARRREYADLASGSFVMPQELRTD